MQTERVARTTRNVLGEMFVLFRMKNGDVAALKDCCSYRLCQMLESVMDDCVGYPEGGFPLAGETLNGRQFRVLVGGASRR